MTHVDLTPRVVATAIAVSMLIAGCGGATEPTGETAERSAPASSAVDGSELAGVQVDVRRDPG